MKKRRRLIIAFVTAVFMLLIFASCKAKIQYVPVENVRTEYINKIQHDSIHLYDSVYVREKGDTIRIEKYKYIYRDKSRTDTIFQTDTIAVPYPVRGETEYKYPEWLVILSVIGAFSVGFTVYKMFKR